MEKCGFDKTAFNYYGVYFSNINRALQLSFSAKVQIDDNFKPFLIDYHQDDNSEEKYDELRKRGNKLYEDNEDVQKYVKGINNKELDDKFREVYISCFINGYELFRELRKSLQTRNANVSMKSLIYNQSVVMCVSAFETYMKDAFIHIVNSYAQIREKILTSGKKISFIDFKDIENGKTTLGDVIAKNINFQNIQAINSAYENIIGFHMIKLLESDKSHYQCLCDTIELRHKIVHDSFIDEELSFDDIKKICNSYENIGSMIFDNLLDKEFLKLKIMASNEMSEIIDKPKRDYG